MSNKLILLGSLTALLAVPACDDTSATAVDYAPLLASLTSTAIPAQQSFASGADELVMVMKALEQTPSATTLATAQGAWRSTRMAFRRLDAQHFGPVADDAYTQRIDLSPAHAGDIDAVVDGSATIDVTAVGVLGGNAKGFLGMEHLLFSTDGDAAVLTSLTGDGAPARRRTFARAMSEEIAATAHQLADAWSDPMKGYALQIASAGKSSERYPRQRGALDDYVNGVAYSLEWVVGLRLAAPLGRTTTGTPDASKDFTQLSDSAVADMTASLDGVRELYQSGGFSAQVRAKSATLDTRAMSQLAECAAKVAAIPAPFALTVVSSTATVQDAYNACKVLKATWNAELTSALGATPHGLDTDGD